MNRQRYATPILVVVLVAAVSLWAQDGRKGTKAMSEAIEIYSVEAGTLVPTATVTRSEEEWQRLLSPDQYRVARAHGTERAFSGPLWDNKAAGVYRCVGCSADLFLSDSKYESGTGWPSFTEPVHPANVGTRVDRSLFTTRTEVHCRRCESHLGHVFPDGPRPTGQRYCINSAALTFEPKAEPARR